MLNAIKMDKLLFTKTARIRKVQLKQKGSRLKHYRTYTQKYEYAVCISIFIWMSCFVNEK